MVQALKCSLFHKNIWPTSDVMVHERDIRNTSKNLSILSNVVLCNIFRVFFEAISTKLYLTSRWVSLPSRKYILDP